MKQFILTLRWLYKYAIFFRKAVTANDLHQPVVYQFARWVVEDRRPFYAFFQIRALRKRLLLWMITVRVLKSVRRLAKR
jgi:hypothetical protein